MPQGNSILDVIGSAARQLPATRRDLSNGAVLMRSAARGGLDSSRVTLIYVQLSFHLDGMLMESNGRLPTASRMHVPMFTGIRKRKLNGWSLSMVDAMSRTAMDSDEEPFERDSKALVWTVKSLTDNVELEPFVEAIPDLLWGPTERRTSYDHHIQCLLRHSDVRLLNRIGDLLISCDAGILTPDAAQRRQITCLKALWALANCAIQWSMPLDFSSLSASSLFLDYDDDLRNPVTVPYITSARALMAWSTFLAFKGRLTKFQHRLAACVTESTDDSPELKEVTESVRQIGQQLSTFRIPPLLSHDFAPSLVYLRLRLEEYLSDNTIGLISYQFLAEAGRWQSPPYRFYESYSVLRFGEPCTLLRESCTPPPSWQEGVDRAINDVVSAHAERMNSNTTSSGETQWIKDTLSGLLSFWQPTDMDCIPRGIIVCLNGQGSVWFLAETIRAHEPVQTRLWNCFPRTLLEGAAEPYPGPSLPREDVFTALWRLAHVCARDTLWPLPQSLWVSRIQALGLVLSTVLNAESRFVHIILSIVALLKFRILREIYLSAEVSHPTLETLSTGIIPGSRIALAAEYLESCTSEGRISDMLPYNVVLTWNIIAGDLEPQEPTHQRRLANSIHTIFSTAVMDTEVAAHEKDTELLRAIVNSACWRTYARGDKTEEEVMLYRLNPHEYGRWLWLDDPTARQKIKESFTDYVKTSPLSGDSRGDFILERVRSILVGLDSWHPEMSAVSEVKGTDTEEGSSNNIL
ncbi:hypothetical protein DFH06DRAFT_1297741 [Mycena polygramma]|nr:hypothetical protein DFH06DRAFT_1297741 [Mycena polygramma]